MRVRQTEVSFEDFVRVRSDSLLRTALLLTGQHRAKAEDLLQLALERAYRHWPRICGPGAGAIRPPDSGQRISRPVAEAGSPARASTACRLQGASRAGPYERDRGPGFTCSGRWRHCRRGSGRCSFCAISMTFPRLRPRTCSAAALAPSRARRPGALPGCAPQPARHLPCPPAESQGACNPKATREAAADD